MPSNAIVVNVKPVNQSVINYKPINQSALDIKVSNLQIVDPTTIYYAPLGTVTIPAGQWIPFVGLTYPNALTIITGGGVRP